MRNDSYSGVVLGLYLTLRVQSTVSWSLSSHAKLANRYFQIEEMEDSEIGISEVFFHGDSSVSGKFSRAPVFFSPSLSAANTPFFLVGLSDGPNFQEAAGSWDATDDGSFTMKLDRVFETGKEQQKDSDMGTFAYHVERKFTGTLKDVGDHTAIEGVVHYMDEHLGDKEVGFFEMIDTTKERPALV
jgi:hypothetical protein